jgi:hypothetical protein
MKIVTCAKLLKFRLHRKGYSLINGELDVSDEGQKRKPLQDVLWYISDAYPLFEPQVTIGINRADPQF